MKRKPLFPETAVAILFICCAFYFFMTEGTSDKSLQSAISAAFILLFLFLYSGRGRAKLTTRLIFTGWFVMATFIGVILSVLCPSSMVRQPRTPDYRSLPCVSCEGCDKAGRECTMGQSPLCLSFSL